MLNKEYISITGATGHLGRSLIHCLLEQGKNVKSLYRSSEGLVQHKNLNWIKGDLNDLNAIENLVCNSSVLIHCAGVISLGDIDQKLVYRVNVIGTQNLINACLNKNIRFIYISSSVADIDDVKNEVLDVKRPFDLNVGFLYARTKAVSEKNVLNAVSKNQLDAVIIRPTAIVGPPDHKPSYFGQTILDLYNNKLPFITSGGYNIVDVRDLARTVVNSIEKGKKGKVYLVGGNYISLSKLAKLVNPSRIPRRISIDLMLFLLPLIQIYRKLFPLKWPLTKESLCTLEYAPKKADCNQAIKDLNHSCRPAKETIQDLLVWFNQNPLK